MYRKVQRVQKVLNDAALHTEKFRKNAGMACAANCHLCCLKKDISASPLEFLPLAYQLYRDGTAESVYNQLEELPENSLCILFSPLGDQPGGCRSYPYRGLICRLFGFAANLNKQREIRLITCKTIKESTAYQQLSPQVFNKAPLATDYYMRLAAIDFVLANEQFQINEAIRKAIELVMTYYLYRGKRKPA